MDVNAILDKHAGTVTGALSTVATAGVFIFKQWREDKRDEKENSLRQEELDRKDKLFYELMAMVKADLVARNQTEQHILQVLRDNAASLTRLSDGIMALVNKN